MIDAASKTVQKVFTARVVPEGAGAKVRRVIGTKDLPRLDPFLMLDHATVKLPAGFPDHPHRGFETVSYMLRGSFLHEDSKGHKGRIGPGDVQWMTAGKGILHSEMPGSKDEESEGLQLWLNLENKNRMIDPAYQEFTKEKIPIAEKDGVSVKVIAGEAYGTKGPVYTRTPAFYLDVSINKNSKYVQKIPANWNSMVYIYRGNVTVGKDKIKAGEFSAVVLKTDDKELLEIETGDTEAKLILLAGKPIGEKIYQYGPFVLGSEKELEQALRDYQHAENGFEGAREWESKIRELAFGEKIDF